MAGYRLCRTKKAVQPYYIEHISSSVYSMEELCYYLCSNLCLLDETILNEGLAEWFQRELELSGLAQRFGRLLEEGAAPSELVPPILREIHYLSQTEQKELLGKLKKLEELPIWALSKQKGDALVAYGKYSNAIKTYEGILRNFDEGSLGAQFLGTVWHNLGCAHGRMFCFEEARICFEKAYERLRSHEVLKSLLSCVFLSESRQAFQEQGKALGVDETTLTRLETELASEAAADQERSRQLAQAIEARTQGDQGAWLETVDILLEGMVREYHKNTGC